MEIEKTSAVGTKQLPYTEERWKIPGYTGHIKGLEEVYAKTPIACQLECAEPDKESFIYTRTVAPPRAMPDRDPCNRPENAKKPQPKNIWPKLQNEATQPSFRPPRSNIANGDLRIDGFITSYSTMFSPPAERMAKIRSPMRNPDLAKATDLRPLYSSSFNRVTEKRLLKMIASIGERLAAKLGNANDNAFKMRRLFKMYDTEATGYIHLEDLRMMMETFGIQLDDDSLLALYHVYDQECTGYLKYEDLMRVLLDEDVFALYTGNNDVTQSSLDLETVRKMVRTIQAKFKSSVEDLRKVLECLDTGKTGFLAPKDFMAGCAALGVTLTDAEEVYVRDLVATDAEGNIRWQDFICLFEK